MRFISIEAGPWGGFVLLLLAIGVLGALYFTTWIVSGLALVVLVVVPAALIIYYGGRRLSRRAIHGRRR